MKLSELLMRIMAFPKVLPNTEKINEINGCLCTDKRLNMSDLDNILKGKTANEILRLAFFGRDDDWFTTDMNGGKQYAEFNPLRKYAFFDCNGNLVSTDKKECEDFLK